MEGFSFRLERKRGKLRAGEMKTPRGVVKTPVFMPVGTRGSVKALSSQDLEGLGAQIVLGNTYHLYLRPGGQAVEKLGGLHELMNWEKVLLTDSGGYQVSSLGHFRDETGKGGGVKKSRIDEEGVSFWSHLDGSKHRFNAEKVIEVQEQLGADIIMAFDEATPDRGKEYAGEAMERTHRWLQRSKKKWEEMEASKTEDELPQALFGIIQGGSYRDLRRESAKFVVEHDLPGLAVGGGSVGQNPEETAKNVGWIEDLLPEDKPRYLMGVGVNPVDVVEAVKAGADMFDCVAPTRLARSGSLYHGELVFEKGKVGFESEFFNGRLTISNSRFGFSRASENKGPIMEKCDCFTCREGYSRVYLHHLYRCRELTFYRLASIHNLRFMVRLAERLRGYVLGDFEGGEDGEVGES